jgi:Asp-tRNA(Asn)/Glu-tRNA(Gln) amidotransferase A subunit family amidase
MLIEIFLDHTGPMTRTASDNAVLLEVLAGNDGFDPRQYAPRMHRYSTTQIIPGQLTGPSRNASRSITPRRCPWFNLQLQARALAFRNEREDLVLALK